MTINLLASLLDLPNELILLIAEHIYDFQHLYAFLITNRRLATLLATSLHRLAACSGLDRGIVALLWAIVSKNEPMLRVLLFSGPRGITIKGQSGGVLHRVSHANFADAQTIAKIFSEGVAINIHVRKGKRKSCEGPALHWAAKVGNEALVRLLLDNGVDINARDRYDHTALHYAAAMKREVVIRFLLCRGADRLAVGVFGDKPLDRARFYGHTDIVMMLLENADITARYKDQRTALHIAAEHPNDDFAATTVKSLLEKGAIVTENYYGFYGITPVYVAIQQGNEKVVRLLIETGVQRGWRSRGHSIIQEAMLSARYGIARYLIETAPASFADASGGTLLHRAIDLPSADTTLVALLLEKGTPVNQSFCGHTPLHNAVRRGQGGIVELLLKHGAKANFRTETNTTPLIFAAAGVAWRPYGIYIEPENRGTCDDMLQIAQLLLGEGAEINAQDEEDRTALHHAVIAGGGAMVSLLLEAGADPTIVDSGWRSPVELARANITCGPEEAAIFRLLQEKTVVKVDISDSVSDCSWA